MDSGFQGKDPYAAREAKKYDNPIPSREFIAEFLGKKAHSFSTKQLALVFHLHTDFEKEALRRRLRAMVRDGQICKGQQGKYQLIQQTELIKGRVIGHRDGFGFVAPEDGTSHVFISARGMRTVMDGDVVTVQVIGYDRKHRREGQIIQILEHHNHSIVGRFFIDGDIAFVEPDNQRIAQDILIPQGKEFHANAGQIVIVTLDVFPTDHTQAVGHITEVLGDYMAPGMEVDVAIRAHGLPHEWPEEALREAKNLHPEVTEEAIKGRDDLRELPFVTIDGDDAKDFDDAVFCEPRPKGGWRLLVAIADVDHYVRPNSALDKEAINRGNSVYFPGEVIPMLPRELSNGLCSLKPKVDRLAVVCEMNISDSGDVLRSRFYTAVINSKARLTYDRVASFLSGKNPKALEHQEALFPHLKNLEKLFELLHAHRAKRGALDFEKDEVKVEFGQGRKIRKLVPVVRNKAHRIIEECMLCANITAASFLVTQKVAALFRVHDGPNPEKLIDLRVLLGEIGIHLGGGDLPTSLDYAQVLEKIKGRPDAHLLQLSLLRSLSQAFYSPDNDGHFGLAFEEYVHFTSPIRRYPDLIVHRAIKAAISHQTSHDLPGYDQLRVLGEHFSMTERRADDATREVLTWLKCEYMLDRVGEEFDGVITGVTGFGLFVELNNIYVEGLIHITSLEGDYFEHDAIHHRLVGTRSGKIYRFGDSIKVKLLHVNLESKRIDFGLISRAIKTTEKTKKKHKK